MLFCLSNLFTDKCFSLFYIWNNKVELLIEMNIYVHYISMSDYPSGLCIEEVEFHDCVKQVKLLRFWSCPIQKSIQDIHRYPWQRQIQIPGFVSMATITNPLTNRLENILTLLSFLLFFTVFPNSPSVFFPSCFLLALFPNRVFFLLLLPNLLVFHETVKYLIRWETFHIS